MLEIQKNRILDGIAGRALDNITITRLDTAPTARNNHRRTGLLSTGALALTLVTAEACTFGATATPGASKTPDKATPSPITTVIPTGTPEATLAPTAIPEKGVKVGSVSFVGTPENVDPKNVDQANHKPFINKIGLGSQMILGEPGGLLVGPDFGYTGKDNPFGANPGGWRTMYESGGSIRPFSAVSQEVLRYPGPAYQILPEGGFMMASAGQMDVEASGIKISLPQQENNNYLLFWRGSFGDMKQNTDKNGTAKITNYKPGHALVGMYESGDKANTAFVSEDQFVQMAETSHSGGTNLGDGGASRLTAVFVDANTGAYTVLQQDLGRNQDASKGWTLVGSNWFKQ